MPTDSTKPSGTTSFKDTALGVIPRLQLLQLELEGTKKGLEFIYDLIKSGNDLKITSSLILELHAISFQWIFPEWAGKFRTIQVTYSGKEAPSFFQIQEMVKNLCDDFGVQLDSLPKPTELEYIDRVVSLLAWFQHRFVFIHPFQDYNGRTARMITSLILLKLKLPPIEIQVETDDDRKEYLKAMQAGDDGDLILLHELIEKALTEGLISH